MSKILRLILLVLDCIFIVGLFTYLIICSTNNISPKLFIIILAFIDIIPQYLYYSIIKIH